MIKSATPVSTPKSHPITADPVHVNVRSETDTLKTVVMCWANPFPINLDMLASVFDASVREQLRHNAWKYYRYKRVREQQQCLVQVFRDYGVSVLFLDNLPGIGTQHYTRDIAFCIDDVFFVARMVLWVVVALMVLDNLGVNITTLVASLGVGGIAVALAVQNVLGDLFASLSIVLDKPFVVGDTIIVGDAQGTVEYIGVKTTRLRSLSGEQIVFSNAELLKSRIHNHQRMVSRRAAFTIGVTYDTAREQLQAIPGMVKEIIGTEQNATFDRAHFARFGASSLDFDVVYHIKTADYLVFMDTQQSIFLKLFEQFGAAGIGFAYPTSVVKLEAGGADGTSPEPLPAARRAPYEVVKPR